VRRTTSQGPAASLGILALGGLALLFSAKVDIDGPGTTPTVSSTAAPTADRLLEPTLPPKPSAADSGAQVFWLYCMPCHGDRGQGLTAEFRQLYPPTEQNCWASGCHGERPYEDGFTLPDRIPALIGEGALQRFPSVAALDGFVRAAMPLQAPGSLTAEEFDQVMAFLVRGNGLPLATAGQSQVPAASATSTSYRSTPTPSATVSVAQREPSARLDPGVALAAVGIGVAIGFLLFLRRRRAVKPPP